MFLLFQFIKVHKNLYNKKSLLNNYWKIKEEDERLILSLSQINNISTLLSKLILLRNINNEVIEDYLNPNLNNNLPRLKLRELLQTLHIGQLIVI